jgi:uncharacterized membrane protein
MSHRPDRTRNKKQQRQHERSERNSDPAKRNIELIVQLERAALHDRSLTDRISDAITCFAGSGKFIALHAAWFTFWILTNAGSIPGITPFDRYPFTFLTMIVSLEAIFLSIFVLISQNRMARQTDRRAHLDLQVDLLAEQEMTMMLGMLQKLCKKAGIEPDVDDELRPLFQQTDPHELMQDLQKNLPAE